MTNEKTCEENCNCEAKYNHRRYRHGNQNHGANGAVYGLGFVGAAIFYIGQATSFWMGVLGLLKAMVWPAFLVYELLKFLVK